MKIHFSGVFILKVLTQWEEARGGDLRWKAEVSLSTKKKKGCRFAVGGSFYWKCARPPFLLPMGVVHRTREKKKNKRAKSVCSLKSAGKSGKKASLLASVDRFCVMCCFQCEVNTHRQKRARDYFEVRVNE